MCVGCMIEGQQCGFDLGWLKFGLELSDEVQDFDVIFGCQVLWIFEIGFGMGYFILEMVVVVFDIDFIGVEVYKLGVGVLFNGLLIQGLGNVWVYSCDVLEVLCYCVVDVSFDWLLLFFFDFWYKKCYYKWWIVQLEFVELVWCKLKVGGVLYMVIDWEFYVEYMLDVMSVVLGYCNQVEDGCFVLCL